MDEREWLAERFETNRTHLRAVAYRMLGSLAEADDAVQEAWLRFNRSDTSSVENLGGWLTTVVARVCLDMLRTRTARREEPLDAHGPERIAGYADGSDPEQEALLAESVGLALLVVLATLAPAERIAFVLHDIFVLSFDEIAPIVGRSPAAARQLASRARRRVQGGATVPDADIAQQRMVIDAFLAAARGGDFTALLTILDPNVILHRDRGVAVGTDHEVRGAAAVAKQVIRGGAQAARPAMVNGAVGIIIAPQGRLLMVLSLTITNGKIVTIDAVAEPTRLEQLELAQLRP